MYENRYFITFSIPTWYNYRCKLFLLTRSKTINRVAFVPKSDAVFQFIGVPDPIDLHIDDAC
jgi:hypothetical protein